MLFERILKRPFRWPAGILGVVLLLTLFLALVLTPTIRVAGHSVSSAAAPTPAAATGPSTGNQVTANQTTAGQTMTSQTMTSQTTPGQTVPGPATTEKGPVDTLKVSTRLVSLEVVVRDRQGHPVPGLTAKDFEVSEQLPPKRGQRPQTIPVFRAVNWEELRSANKNAAALPPGVYSNLVNKQNAPVPPTVLLFDGINTDLESQLQVHQQMVKMLGSIPADVPVAVFLMGDRLRLLQSFTTDPKLLREAAAKTLVVGQTAPDQDPMDDPNSLSAAVEGAPHVPAGLVAGLAGFEQHAFSFAISMRTQKTLDALRGIARYLDGYPGRKNVLWISTSFPLMFWPQDQSSTGSLSDMRDFQGEMQEVGSALMDAKIAIYPMDPGGVRTQSIFEASARVRQPSSGQRMGQAIQREDTLRQGAQQVMQDLAEETGGRVCLNDNDLGDCVKKAVDDANSYYELAYYPDAGEWRGEYHHIVVKTTHSGVHLSYREGYYARALGSAEGSGAAGPQQDDPALHRAACEDPLASTAVLLMAKAIPPDEPGAAKYFLAVDPHMLTFTPLQAGIRELGISVAACTFDKMGQPMQYLQKNSLAKLNEQQFAATSHAVAQTFQFAPKPGVARVRLLVRDTVSGRIGSVDIPYVDSNSVPAATSAVPAPARP
jgi:VWFA-related protein